MARSKIKVNTSPVADKYSSAEERIIEYSSEAGGGLIAFKVRDGKLIVDLYRHDETVEIRVGQPS